MTAILLSALFTTSAFLAIATIAASWRRYGRTALALRAELGACDDWREVRVQISEVTVRRNATVLRHDFTRLPARPSVPSALHAAA